ncbi:MAG TPA: SLC13 family permease [Ilumatobacter sp.]|nr:SLC13 family permease [Ilumatobacter sp.]
MTIEAWTVLGVVVATMVVLALDRVPTVVAMTGGLLVLLLTESVSDDVVLSGLSSPATATIAALYVVAAAIAATGALSTLIDRVLFGRTGNVGQLGVTTASLSAFVPNTPLVALAAPRVVRWSRQHGASASKLLMPLSFASILGGVITLLGTSTNLVVSDSLRSSGDDALGVFEITPVGLPVAIVGISVMVLTAPRLLRHRTAPSEAVTGVRQFEGQMVVTTDGPIAGRTVADGGLRDLDGIYLAALERDERVHPVAAGTVLEAGDLLFFVGDIGRLVDLQQIAGLTSAEQPHLLDTEGPGVRLYEAVVAGRSDLAGRTLKESGFRSRYGAAVLAVQRSSDGMRGKLGSIPIHAGDVLVVLAAPEFNERWRDHGDFSLVASLEEPPPPRRNRAWVAIGAMIGLVVLSAAGVLSLFAASVIAAAVVVVGGALSMNEARHAIDLNVVLTIAASISLGSAVAASGLALEIGELLVRVADPLGAVGLLATTIIATQVLTELLSNSGAAALMVPIAMAAATASGADPRAFAIGVLVGASCSFLTPVGYQTNLMVYSLGGYRFGDFTRVGFPLTVASTVVTTTMLTILY